MILRLRENWLIAFGVTIGFALGFTVSPYVLEVEALERFPTANEILGLKEGIGDIVGGILGGVVTFAAAFFTLRAGFKREDDRRAEERTFEAHLLLHKILPIWSLIQAVDEELEKYPPSILTFYAHPWILQYMIDACDMMEEWEIPSQLLPLPLRKTAFSMIETAPSSGRTFRTAAQVAGASPLGASFGSVYSAKNDALKLIKPLSELVNGLVDDLNDVITMRE